LEQRCQNLPTREISVGVPKKLRPRIDYLDPVDIIPQVIDRNLVDAESLGEPSYASPSPRYEDEWPDMARYVVQTGEDLIHQVEIDLPQA